LDWLDRPLGPMRIRAWGLVVNFLANALALYGLALFLREGAGLAPLITGLALTAMLLLILAVPSR